MERAPTLTVFRAPENLRFREWANGFVAGRAVSKGGLQAIRRRMGSWIGTAAEWRRELAVAVACGLFFGALGPFGAYLMGPTVLRMGYWTAMFVTGQVLFGVGVRFALCQGRKWGQPDWFVLPLAVAVFAAPLSLLCAAVSITLWPSVVRYVQPAEWYGQVLLISLPLNVVLVWLRRGRLAPADPLWVEVDTPGDLVSRLPARLGRRVLCLQMEDHYVRVHTDLGSHLLNMPLKDAIAALGGMEGLQTHRSWWVAREAVVEVSDAGRAIKLRLSNDLWVPVARSAVTRLREAGWLALADQSIERV